MTVNYPQSVEQFRGWQWPQIEPILTDLLERPLADSTVESWLADWSRIAAFIFETATRAEVATTRDTTDEAAETFFISYLENVVEPYRAAENKLKKKLIISGLQPPNFDIPLRDIAADVEIFRDENMPLLTQEQQLSQRYDRIIGAQTVEWDGAEKTLEQLRPIYLEHDRDRREQVWRLASDRQLADRAALNDLWGEFLALRLKITGNTGLPGYRDYKWRELHRFDYTPDDCARFRDAIETVVVPAAGRIYERRREQLGYESLRPWDLQVDPLGRDPLHPFKTVDQLEDGIEAIFNRVDPALADQFRTMRAGELLDLDNRKGKAPGGYCTSYSHIRKPFIFMNAVGLHDDVQTMLHEGGHAFHVFATNDLPYLPQTDPPMEFCEVASMAMELLAAPYLADDAAGFYDDAAAARARAEHLEGIILFWPYMAVVDAFQHWIYTHPDDAADTDRLDATWADLWGRFMKGVDWSGLDDALMTGWQRKLHIFQVPFYYIEYGLAQLGAVQVWQRSRTDHQRAVADYRAALALGNTRSLPDLFAAAGAAFKPDAETLGAAVEQVEAELTRLADAPKSDADTGDNG